ncbi:aldo/keto reductase [Methylocella silvestris]|uniref:NADP-dependent oxidoreductase domain-containing protein n=1 Tax=Methylocella silvestris TaxID=199596 RepID=A0A2J7TKD2_METSI|nr:aldo/keto reductase [Methylocella silvestris]PNG27225.1 hypothetical protein CR492_03840 [Methylocella silvestris]
MQKIVIPATNISTSRFIFGTASLFNAGSFRDRQKLLDGAADHGFSHFDTAPYYGFGMAERDLRHLLERRPSLTITTKVGIYSPGGEMQPAAAILLRKIGGKLLPSLSRPTIDWNVARARKTLEGSLRRLGRERIDLYMMHEPLLPLLDADEWLRWLEQVKAAGQVGAFGLALTADKLEPFLAAGSALANVVQTFDSLEKKEADVLTRYHRPFQITYGYVSGARAQGNHSSVTDILQEALKRNPDGAIVVSTKRPERLGQYADLLGHG